MSQFSDEKNGVPSDPTQRTLSNFIVPGDPSKRNINDSTQLCSEISDNAFSIDTNADFLTDSFERCSGLMNSGSYDHMSEIAHGNCILGQNTEEVESNLGPQSNELTEKVCYSLRKLVCTS